MINDKISRDVNKHTDGMFVTLTHKIYLTDFDDILRQRSSDIIEL